MRVLIDLRKHMMEAQLVLPLLLLLEMMAGNF